MMQMLNMKSTEATPLLHHVDSHYLQLIAKCLYMLLLYANLFVRARGRSFNDDDSLSLRQHARALYTKSFHQIIILKAREKSRARARVPRK
jgi:hypothetical protein